MRKLNPDSITFLPPKIREPRNIDFDELEADITILAHQSDIGKTYSVIQYMKENPNTFYFTGRHAIIDEIIKDMGITNLKYAHWEGFDRKCPRREVVEWHKENPLPIGIICSICKKENCEYRKQFDARERVFAPYEYLKTDYVKTISKPRFS